MQVQYQSVIEKDQYIILKNASKIGGRVNWIEWIICFMKIERAKTNQNEKQL